MRSVTSYFNPTLYRKTMGRFWPLWTLYGLVWLFMMPLNMLNEYFDRYRSSDPVIRLLGAAKDAPEFLTLGVGLAVVMGVLSAMAVFGYLYNNRSACMLHALPMKRETLFTTQYLAGLSFMLLPHLAVAALTAAVELTLLPSMYWGAAFRSLLVWLLVQSGTCLFFFSFAAFCAMFTGHILALPAFYGILNALVMAIYTLVNELMSQFFYGYASSGGKLFVAYCTPAAMLLEACEWAARWTDGMPSADQYLRSPGTVAAYAAAGLAFAVLALMVYRRRHVESAGDVVAIPVVRPVFKYGVSFCAGLCLGTFTAVFFFNWHESGLILSLCVLFWAAVGYFAAEMLLKKSFRVFRAWKGCLAAVAVMALLCFSFTMDFFGVETRVPDPAKVTSVWVGDGLGYPYDDGYSHAGEITDPGQIEEFVALHQAIVDQRDRNDGGADDFISFNVTYTLADGSAMARRYNSVPLFTDEVEREGSTAWAADRLLRDRELVAQRYRFDELEKGRPLEASLTEVECTGEDGQTERRDEVYLDGAAAEDLMGLWRAIRQDFDEGTIGVRYLFDDQERRDNTYRTDLVFTWMMPALDQDGERYEYSDSLRITLTPNAKNTLTWLEEMGGLGEYRRPVSHPPLDPEAKFPIAADGPSAEAVEIK